MKSISKKHNLSEQDVVLANLAGDDPRLENLFNDCLDSGAAFFKPSQKDQGQAIAKTMIREDVTVVATSPESWPGIYDALNHNPGNLNRIRTLLYNGKAEPEQRLSLIPSALSRGMLNDTYAAYQLAPAVKKGA